MKAELTRHTLRKKLLTDCIMILVATILMPIMVWSMGLPKVLISITIFLMVVFTFLFILTESLKYLTKKPMLNLYIKLEAELGEYEVIKVLSGEQFNITSEPSLLILTKKNELLRIQCLKNEEFFWESVS